MGSDGRVRRRLPALALAVGLRAFPHALAVRRHGERDTRLGAFHLLPLDLVVCQRHLPSNQDFLRVSVRPK